MELLVTYRPTLDIERLKEGGVSGIIAGTSLSHRYDLTLDGLVDLRKRAQTLGLGFYADIDILVAEAMGPVIAEYLDFLGSIKCQGIYFHDLSVYFYALNSSLKEALIYDSGPLITNSLDATFFLQKGIKGVVLARELDIGEIIKIGKMTNGQVDVQVGGHIMMAESRRNFVTDYLDYIGRADKEGDHFIIEETRDGKAPIVEDRYGTRIYTDTVLLCLKEFADIVRASKRQIIDTTFLSDDLVYDMVAAYAKVTADDADTLTADIIAKHGDKTFSTALLHEEMSLTKEAA